MALTQLHFERFAAFEELDVELSPGIHCTSGQAIPKARVDAVRRATA